MSEWHYIKDGFHVGDKVFLDNTRGYQYGKVMAISIEDNLMVISPINDNNVIINVHIDSPHIHKIDFLPKDYVVIHDLLKDYSNKKGVVCAYSWQIDRYRVMVDNDDPNPHWFAPFELTFEDSVDNDKDNDDWNGHFINFSSFNPIKVTLSDKGKRVYKYYFGTEPPVDANGKTEFINLAQFMKTFFIYRDKYNYMLEDDKIFVKEID